MKTSGACVTPTSGSSVVLVDTSVAVPLVVGDHEHHESTTAALGRRRAGLAGHAAFETFSVLTRLPGPGRVSPSVVGRLLAASFPETRFLSAESSADLLAELATRGVSGGLVYDALVGAVALEHELTLLTRDRRALPTYRDMGVVIELLG
jgi:predicted nucleic acid-binding protein